MNQDGGLTQADVDAFVAGWRANTSALSDYNKYKKGDMNFDGVTDLSDAYLLHLAFSGSGSGSFSLADLTGSVPEPGTLCLFSLAVVFVCPAVRRADSRKSRNAVGELPICCDCRGGSVP